MPKVFIPQIPSRFDSATKLWIPTVNMDAAKSFGDLVVMLPPNANRMHTAPLVQAVKERMSDYCEDDCIVAVGDPSLIAAAACIAVRKAHGTLRLLKWDRMSSSYIAVEMELG